MNILERKWSQEQLTLEHSLWARLCSKCSININSFNSHISLFLISCQRLGNGDIKWLSNWLWTQLEAELWITRAWQPAEHECMMRQQLHSLSVPSPLQGHLVQSSRHSRSLFPLPRMLFPGTHSFASSLPLGFAQKSTAWDLPRFQTAALTTDTP